jgi:hypothetical protein
VGNPYSFGLAGVSGKLHYGKEWASKEVEISFTGELASGRWTRIQVVVNPSTPDDLRNLNLYLEASQVRGIAAPQ